MRKRYSPYSLAALAALITFIVYLPALRNGFVTWDDDLNVYGNLYIRSLSWSFVTWAFSDLTISYWQPLVWVSHAVDYSLWGLNPLGHHLTNVLLHAANTLLVAVLVMRLLEAAAVRQPGGAGGREREGLAADRPAFVAAAVTGLLFGLHPLHVESVAWITERKDLLSALFFLLCLLTYLRYAVADSGTSMITFMRDRRYLLAFSCFVLAVSSKPMAVTLPVVLLLLDWHPLGRMGSRKEVLRSLAEKLPFAVISGIVSLAALSHKKLEAVISLQDAALGVRMMGAARALIVYLRQMAAPFDLSPYYPDPNDLGALSLAHLAPVVFVCGITAACLFLARKRKVFLAGWGYYVVTLLPVLGLIKTKSVIVADRFTYLPSLGPFLLAGLGAAWLWTRTAVLQRHGRAARRLVAGVAVLICAVLSYGTVRQIAVWEDGVTLWSRVIEREPVRAPLAYNNRAVAYQARGRFDEAIRDLSTLIALDGTVPGPYNNRGVVWRQMGQVERAIADHTTAIGLKPDLPDSYIARGVALREGGQLERAVTDFDRAIKLDPNNADAYIGRGWTFSEMGRADRAMADYDRAVEIDPMAYVAFNNRGMVFQGAGQIERAIEDYSRAVKVNPLFAEALTNRGLAYEQTGDLRQAFADYTAAIKADPSFANAYNNRGLLHERAGRLEQALEDFNAAVALHPAGAEAYNNRGLVFEDLGNLDRAIGDYDKAIELQPGDYLAFSNRGMVQRKAGRLARAVEDQTRAIALRPDYADAYVYRGDCYRDMGKEALAKRDFRRACDLGNETGCSSARR